MRRMRTAGAAIVTGLSCLHHLRLLNEPEPVWRHT